MNPTVVVAGIGNIFFRDDAFGVEVLRRLSRPQPPGVLARDYGVGGVHLAYDLLSRPDLLVLADVVRRGVPPGTLCLMEPELNTLPTVATDLHSVDLVQVFNLLRQLGGVPPRTLLLGCEPADLSEGVGLTPEVEAAVSPAVQRIEALVAKEIERQHLPCTGEEA